MARQIFLALLTEAVHSLGIFAKSLNESCTTRRLLTLRLNTFKKNLSLLTYIKASNLGIFRVQ